MLTETINPKTGKKRYYKDNPEHKKMYQRIYYWKNKAIKRINESQLDNVKNGYVYAIGHPMFDSIKIGRTHNIEKRLSQLNTGCPDRSYYVIYSVYHDDCHKAEKKAHELANSYGDILKGEWFKITREQAILVLAETDLNINGG